MHELGTGYSMTVSDDSQLKTIDFCVKRYSIVIFGNSTEVTFTPRLKQGPVYDNDCVFVHRQTALSENKK